MKNKYEPPTESDIVIQQEGKVLVATLQTDKARKAFYNEDKSTKPKEKLDILSGSIKNLMAWAIIHDLTVESKFKLLVNPK